MNENRIEVTSTAERLDTAVAVSRTVSNTPDVAVSRTVSATDAIPTPLDVCRMLIAWDESCKNGVPTDNIMDAVLAARRAVAHYEALPADFVAPIRHHEPETHGVQLIERPATLHHTDGTCTSSPNRLHPVAAQVMQPTPPTLSDAVGVEDDPFATR